MFTAALSISICCLFFAGIPRASAYSDRIHFGADHLHGDAAMPITTQCVHCQKTLRVPDSLAGKRGKCPECGGVFDIPADGVPATAGSSPSPIQAAAPNPVAAPPPAFSESTGDDFDFSEGARRPMSREGAAHPDTFRKLYNAMLFLLLGGMAVAFGGAVILVVISAAARDTSSNNFEEVARFEDGRMQPVRRAPRASSSDEVPPIVVAAMIAVFGLVAVMMIGYVVAFFTFLYKGWALIQDGRARTTPGLAIALLFIPCFNLYWNFVAQRGLAEDLNYYAISRRLKIQHASVGMMTAALVLQLCGMIPFIGGLFSLTGLVLHLIALNTIKHAAMGIASAKLGLTE